MTSLDPLRDGGLSTLLAVNADLLDELAATDRQGFIERNRGS